MADKTECVCVCVFVCLSVCCWWDFSKTTHPVFMKLYGMVEHNRETIRLDFERSWPKTSLEVKRSKSFFFVINFDNRCKESRQNQNELIQFSEYFVKKIIMAGPKLIIQHGSGHNVIDYNSLKCNFGRQILYWTWMFTKMICLSRDLRCPNWYLKLYGKQWWVVVKFQTN